MATYTLPPNEHFYESNLVPTGGETANSIHGNSGNDTIIGNQYNDWIFGNDGHDQLYGEGGNDFLLGGAGNDLLSGGIGNDSLLGGDGDDDLHGGAGADRLWGGAGDDYYFYSMSDGGDIDTINDDLSPTGSPGAGGGTDALFMDDVLYADIRFAVIGNDLYVTNAIDELDGDVDFGVKIEDFFSGGNNVIEYIVGSDGYYYDLSSYV